MFEGNTTNYPTLFELYEFVNQAGKNFHASAKEALLTALAPLLMELNSVLAYRKGWDILGLAKEKIIFEFNSASEVGKNLLTNCGLILPTFQSRVAQGFSNVGRDKYLAIYFDEGSSLIENDDAVISRWIGLVRGVGLALVISNQSAVSISQRVLSNLPNRFICQLSSYADLSVMASSCGMDSNQKKYLAQNLTPGLLAGHLANGSWRHPFLFTTPLMNSGSNQFQGDGCKALDSLPVVPAPEFLNWQPAWMRKEIIPTEQEPTAPKQITASDIIPAEQPSGTGLEPDELRLLEAIAADPCQPVSFYPTKIHISKRKALRLRKSLLDKKLIQEQTMQTGRGRPSILLAVSDKAMDLLEQLSLQGGP